MIKLSIQIQVNIISFSIQMKREKIWAHNSKYWVFVITCWSPHCRRFLEWFHEAVIKTDEDDTTRDSTYTENTKGISRSIKRNKITADETTSTSS